MESPRVWTVSSQARMERWTGSLWTQKLTHRRDGVELLRAGDSRPPQWAQPHSTLNLPCRKSGIVTEPAFPFLFSKPNMIDVSAIRVSV